jgi:hypothetical protein
MLTCKRMEEGSSEKWRLWLFGDALKPLPHA